LLDLEESLTQPCSPLRDALASYLLPGDMKTQTYVLDYRDPEGSQRLLGFAQMRPRRGLPEADIVYIAPALAVGGNGVYATWQRLLTYLCVVAGERGVQRLYTRVASDGEEHQIFRHVGFVPYAREDIYRLTRVPPLSGEKRLRLRPQTASDSWGLQRLYATISPRPVQQAEVLAQGQWEIRSDNRLGRRSREGYVLEDQSEIIACLQIRRGRLGSWLKMLLHPQAYAHADSLVRQGLELLAVPERPVYCCVREYNNGGLRALLNEQGFQFFVQQTIMVKHTTVWAKEPVPKLIPILEKSIESAAPTISRAQQASVAELEWPLVQTGGFSGPGHSPLAQIVTVQERRLVSRG
jgi:hypothetical protein